jgi:hypothetical protein
LSYKPGISYLAFVEEEEISISDAKEDDVLLKEIGVRTVLDHQTV